ncbi:hypothetical protein ACQJBY_046233 [Aegilops geniculata]
MPVAARVWMAEALFIGAMLLAVSDAATFTTDPLDPRAKWYKPYDRVSCKLFAARTGPAYRHCPKDVLTRAINWGSGKSAFNRPVLARQTLPQPPRRWIMLEVHGAGNDVAMLAVRGDNLYVVGFATQSGAWFVFKNRANLIPSATVLPSSDNYTGLVGFGGHKNLEQLRLGRTTTLRAIAHLSGFAADYAPDADDGCMRRAVATLVVTIFEAARFAPIQQSISDNWVNGVTFKPQQWIVVQWRTVSCALLVSRQHGGQWASPETAELRGGTHHHTGPGGGPCQRASVAR